MKENYIQSHYQMQKHIQYIFRTAVKSGNIELIVHGQENIPKENGFMIYSNHQGMFDILAIPLIGVIPDDENVVVSTNQGEPLVGNATPAGMAYQNVVQRIEGKDVPFMNFEKSISFLAKVTGIFHRV